MLYGYAMDMYFLSNCVKTIKTIVNMKDVFSTLQRNFGKFIV